MGADCCNENKGDASSIPMPDGGSAPVAFSPKAGGAPSVAAPVMKDLKAESLDGKDIYEKFEYGLPFYRTNVKVFMDQVKIANAACGGKDLDGFVTIDALCKVFTSPAWAQLT